MERDKAEDVTQTKKARTSRPKVKTGCLTCKNRRVKCDETRPACIRCQKSHRTCEGYAAGLMGPPRPLAPKIEPSQTMIEDLRQEEAPVISRSPSLSFFEDESEESLAPKPIISASASKVILDDQRSLGYSNEPLDYTRSRDFAPKEYGKAPEQMRVSPLEGGELHVDRGQPASSMLSSMGSPVVEDDPVSAFARLRGEVTNIDTPQPADLSRPLVSETLERTTFMPASFASLAEARAHWEVHLRLALSWNHQPGYDALQASAFPKLYSDMVQGQDLNRMPHQWDTASLARLEEERKQHAASVEQWATAFGNVWTYCNTDIGADEFPGAAILRMQCLCGRISFAAAAVNHESIYDNFVSEFIEMVWLARRVLERSETARLGGANMSSLSIGAITSMYFVVNKCRDRWIRRQVLELYDRYPRCDGGWDSAMTAAVGRWAMEKEEAGLTEDQVVPETNRIRLVEVKIPSRRREALVGFSIMEGRDPRQRVKPPKELVRW